MQSRIGMAVVCGGLALAGLRATAQDLGGGLPPDVQQDLEFVQGLQEAGLPDYADLVMQRITRPEARLQLEVLKIKGDIQRGALDGVADLIAKRADQTSQETWAMKLALADGYYTWGKYDKAKAIYQGFFGAFATPPKEMAQFYLESAYKYAQMMLLLGDLEASVKAYDFAISVVPKEDRDRRHIRRQFLGEQAELLLKVIEKQPAEQREPNYARIDERLKEILWVQDLWFGKGIVVMAHMYVLKNDIAKAMKTVEDYMEILKQIDQALRESGSESGEDLTRLSPIAQVRYLVGRMLQEEAEKLIQAGGYDRAKVTELLIGKQSGREKSNGALQHFVNVFIRYPGTSWAPDAGIRLRRVQELIEKELGGKIDFKVSGDQMKQVEVEQFKQARILFNQQQFAESAEAYENALNLFPEGETAPDALTDLAMCYIEQADEMTLLYAEMVANHIAERFARHKTLMTKAGNNVLRIAGKFRDMKMNDRYEMCQSAFFDFMPDHPQVPELLFYLAEQAFQEKDYEKAKGYHTRLVETYPKNRLFHDSLNRIASCYAEAGDTVNEVKTLQALQQRLVDDKKIGYLLINTKYRLASAYKTLGSKDGKFLVQALKDYDEIIKLLTATPEKYALDDKEREANQTILDASKFFKAMGLTQVKTGDAEKDKRYVAAAVGILEDLVKTSPTSKLAPNAYSQLGTYYTILGKAEDAQKVLKTLKEKFPDSPEARNVDYVLAMNLLQLGRRQEALRVFKAMFEGGGKYSDQQIITAGQELLKAGEGEIALQAFTTVMGRAEKGSGAHQQAGLGQGRAQLLQKQYPAAVKTYEELKSLYDKTFLVIDIAQGLVEGYSELGAAEKDLTARIDLFNKAIEQMKLMRKYAGTNNAAKARNDIELARIYVRKMDADKKAGDQQAAEEARGNAVTAYQSFVLFCDATAPGVREWMATAYAEATPLLADMENWPEVNENCTAFFEKFPSDRKYGPEMRRLQSKARVKLTVSGGSKDGTQVVEEEPTEIGIDDSADAGAEPGAEEKAGPAAEKAEPAAEKAEPAAEKTEPAADAAPATPAAEPAAAPAKEAAPAKPKPAAKPARPAAAATAKPAAGTGAVAKPVAAAPAKAAAKPAVKKADPAAKAAPAKAAAAE